MNNETTKLIEHALASGAAVEVHIKLSPANDMPNEKPPVRDVPTADSTLDTSVPIFEIEQIDRQDRTVVVVLREDLLRTIGSVLKATEEGKHAFKAARKLGYLLFDTKRVLEGADINQFQDMSDTELVE